MDPSRRDQISLACRWPILRRRIFADKLAKRGGHLCHRRDSKAFIAAQLISNPVHRAKVLTHGLKALSLGADARSIDEWMSMSPFRTTRWSIPEQVRCILDSVLDLPGLALSEHERHIEVGELFPVLPPIVGMSV